jgi:Tol biopolymer transport system component
MTIRFPPARRLRGERRRYWEPTRLTNTRDLHNWAPEWSPDGKRIASRATSTPGTAGPCDRDVYVMDAVDSDGDGNGDNLINVTNDRRLDYQPDWSPDGPRSRSSGSGTSRGSTSTASGLSRSADG